MHKGKYVFSQLLDFLDRNDFKLNGNVYAFDSTTVDLCLSTFEWALFRKRKGGIKVHDTKAMDVIPYEENSFYIFDRGYNDFKRLHNIESIGAYFVIRGKSKKKFIFFTNALTISTVMVAKLYHNR